MWLIVHSLQHRHGAVLIKQRRDNKKVLFKAVRWLDITLHQSLKLQSDMDHDLFAEQYENNAEKAGDSPVWRSQENS